MLIVLGTWALNAQPRECSASGFWFNWAVRSVCRRFCKAPWFFSRVVLCWGVFLRDPNRQEFCLRDPTPLCGVQDVLPVKLVVPGDVFYLNPSKHDKITRTGEHLC